MKLDDYQQCGMCTKKFEKSVGKPAHRRERVVNMVTINKEHLHSGVFVSLLSLLNFIIQSLGFVFREIPYSILNAPLAALLQYRISVFFF